MPATIHPLPSPAAVHGTPDPERPGRTAYLITGASAAVVQSEIDRIMRDAESAPGEVVARARGPHRCNRGYLAAVEVIATVRAAPVGVSAFFRMLAGSAR